MDYGLDTEIKEEIKVSAPKKAPFAYWTVGDREYKLKLTTTAICQLEEKFKGNLITLISSGSVPALGVMLTIIQGAMKAGGQNVKYAEVQEVFDQYCEEGGTQISLMMDVLIPIYEVSGFFSTAQSETMNSKLMEAKELI